MWLTVVQVYVVTYRKSSGSKHRARQLDPATRFSGSLCTYTHVNVPRTVVVLFRNSAERLHRETDRDKHSIARSPLVSSLVAYLDQPYQ